VVTPLNQSLQPTDTIIPPGQSSQTTDVVTPSSARAGSPPPTKEAVPSEEAEPSKQPLARRTVVVGLAGITGLAAVGGGIAWLIHSQPPASSRQGQGSPSVPASPAPIIRRNALYTYHGHSSSVWSVAWSPDGKRLASGSADGTVQVWDATTG